MAKKAKFQGITQEQRESLPNTNVDNLLVKVKYYLDEENAHIKVKDDATCKTCKNEPCLDFCPANVFTKNSEGKVMVSYQGCLECGSCRIACPYGNIDWVLPVGGYGVAYKFG